MARSDGEPKKPGRLGQIRETYKITKKGDPKIGLILAGVFLGILALFIIAAVLTKLYLYLIPLGIAIALLVTVIIFGKRAEKSAYGQIHGQPGAAAAVLKSLRAGWFVTPAVAANKSQDMVHRIVGRPGVILVSEGSPNRVAGLLAAEKKRIARFVPEVPITEIQSGDEAGQVPIDKLNKKVMKLPKTLKPAQVTEIRKRLEALATNPVAAPKGPMPKSVRAARIPRG